jgi:hypothetical protein
MHELRPGSIIAFGIHQTWLDSLLQSGFDIDLTLQQEICAFRAAEDGVLRRS